MSSTQYVKKCSQCNNDLMDCWLTLKGKDYCSDCWCAMKDPPKMRVLVPEDLISKKIMRKE